MHHKLEKKEMFLGDFVRWDSGDKQCYGQIVKRVSDGKLNIPGTDYVMEASEDNPAYLINVYEMDEEGSYSKTSVLTGIRGMGLVRVPSPDIIKDIDINIDQTEIGNESEETEIENEDEAEAEEDDYEDDYENDRQQIENMMNEIDEYSNVISKGDYVTFEVSGSTYTGRVVDIVNEGIVTSSMGFNLEGKEDDPAVLLRVYVVDENGELQEMDLKLVQRMSSLVKLSKLCSKKSLKNKYNKKEVKTFAFEIRETKETEIDGVKYGLVRGYASTYGNVDRGNDRVVPGAFSKSLDRYRKANRPVKMYFNHDSNEIIGGFPIQKITDDENGLYVEGQVNLEVQKGREAYALAKQGVMQDFSIGYTVDDYDMKGGVRELKQLELWEISMVGEPMNEMARITAVKNNLSKIYQYEEIKNLKDKRELEKLLRDSGAFSRKAATYLSSLFELKQSDSVSKIDNQELKSLLNYLNSRKG